MLRSYLCEENVCMSRRTVVVLRSVAAWVLSLYALPLVNQIGGELAPVFGLSRGGDARLAYDLLWVGIAGVTGSMLMVRIAAVAKTAHAWGFLAVYLALGLVLTGLAWDDFPRWFTLACVLTLPLQVWLGWWLAFGRGVRGEE